MYAAPAESPINPLLQRGGSVGEYAHGRMGREGVLRFVLRKHPYRLEDHCTRAGMAVAVGETEMIEMGLEYDLSAFLPTRKWSAPVRHSSLLVQRHN